MWTLSRAPNHDRWGDREVGDLELPPPCRSLRFLDDFLGKVVRKGGRTLSGQTGEAAPPLWIKTQRRP
jgi:hypothetical protein